MSLLTPFLLLVAVHPRYHDYDETVAELHQLVTQHPGICRLETIGYSTAWHLPLLALKLSDHPDQQENEPRILYNGIHHACELIGNEVCLYLASYLTGAYGHDPDVTRWLDSNQVFIVPIVNPDGHAINMEDRDTMWRKNLHDFNHNGQWDPDTDGVDLNRNYDFLWELGDPNQGSRNFRGYAPFSENETQAIRDLCRREKFVFDICFHSDIDPTLGEAVYFPWRWGNGFCPDYPEIKTIADSVACRIINDFGNWHYATIYGRATEGGLARNWMYHALGIFSYTIEVSLGYQPPGNRVDSICERVRVGAVYLLDRAHRSILTGHVRDSLTGEPLVAEVKVLEATSTPDTIQPRLSDSLYGRFWRPLRPGTYNLEFARAGYLTRQLSNVAVTAGTATVLDVPLVRNPAIEDQPYVRSAGNALVLVDRALAGHAHAINFSLPRASLVQLDVLDRSGRLARHLVRQRLGVGLHSVVWDWTDDTRARVATGVYFLRLKVGDQTATRKLSVAD